MGIEYNCVNCFFLREMFKIHSIFQTLPEIQQLNLVIVIGESEVNCDGRRNRCNVSLEESSMTNVSIHSFIHSLVLNLRGRAGKNHSPFM